MVIAFFSATIAFTQTETNIIGGSLRNGNFDADASGTDQRSFADTPFWINLAGSQSETATRTSQSVSSPRCMTVAEATHRLAGQDTGYTIGSRDFFKIGYSWIEGFNWHASDQIAVRLFTTSDNTTGGVVNTFATLLSGEGDTSFQPAYGMVQVPDSEVGKRLFVALDSQDGNGSTNGFALLDDFQLSVVTSGGDSIIFYDSFEFPDISGTSNTNPAGWNGAGGMNDEDAGLFSTPYGDQVLWMNSGTATTTAAILSEVLQERYTYTLTCNVARRSDQGHNPNSYVISLLADGTPLASANGAATQTNFTESVEIVFTPDQSHAALIGQTLVIGLGVDGLQPQFDNVMLVAEAPPPLGTLLIVR
jgi:hypothetical protein